MGDKQLNKLAVSGVNPQPVSEKSWVYPYYTWHPKEENVDDGAMLPIKCGGYTAQCIRPVRYARKRGRMDTKRLLALSV